MRINGLVIQSRPWHGGQPPPLHLAETQGQDAYSGDQGRLASAGSEAADLGRLETGEQDMCISGDGFGCLIGFLSLVPSQKPGQ